MKILSALLLLLLLASNPLLAQSDQQNSYALLIGGLGGGPEYSNNFRDYLFQTKNALIDELGFRADHVVLLGEASISDQGFVDDVSNAENITQAFKNFSGLLGADDQFFLVFFGHGSFDGDEAYVNIPRKDLGARDYAELLDGIKAGRIVVINTTSASAPFIDALSGPGRVIVTATRRGSQRNDTIFPKYLVEALENSASDLDKNGDLSVQEIFTYASEATAREYETAQNLATEHALLDDNADGEGSRLDELAGGSDGNLASLTLLRRGNPVLASGQVVDPVRAAEILTEKNRLEQEIASVKSQKSQLPGEDYYSRLEVIFVKLARLNASIE